MKYRIAEVNYINGTKCYHIQKQVRLFFFGPLIWKTYSDYDGYKYKWSYFLKNGIHFDSIEGASNFISKFKMQDGWKITSSKVIGEY